MTARKLLLVVDDNRRFAIHVFRQLTGAMEFGFDATDKKARFRRVAPDGELEVVWHRPIEDGFDAFVDRLGKADEETWSIIDVHGIGVKESSQDWSRYYHAFLKHAKGGDPESRRNRVWVMSSYGHWASGPDGLIAIRPKTIESLRAFQTSMGLSGGMAETPTSKRSASEMSILVTGAGFELKEAMLEGVGIGCPDTRDLIRQIRPNGEQVDWIDGANDGWPYPRSHEHNATVRRAAEEGNLDDYWDGLLLDFDRTPQTARQLEIAYREAFRRAFLGHDLGHQIQCLAAARLDWNYWLTTNYTRFADRAVDFVNDASSPSKAWRAIATPIEADAVSPYIKSGGELDGNRILIKLHGDIGHVWTMAIAGMDKAADSKLTVRPQLHRMYGLAESMILDSVWREGVTGCTWHIVGHGLKDKSLTRLLATVMQRSPHVIHRLLVVAPIRGQDIDAAAVSRNALSTLRTRLAEVGEVRLAEGMKLLTSPVRAPGVYVGGVPCSALDYLSQLSATGIGDGIEDLARYRPSSWPPALNTDPASDVVPP